MFRLCDEGSICTEENYTHREFAKGDICRVRNNVNNHAYMSILQCFYIKWNLGLLTWKTEDVTEYLCIIFFNSLE